MNTTNVETNRTKPPKETWQQKTEKAVKNTADNAKKSVFNAAEKIKNNSEIIEKTTGVIIFTGAAIVEGIVLFANLSPYMKASNILIAKALGQSISLLKPLGWMVGIAGLAAVQVGEIRPLLLKNPTKEKYARASALSAIFYAIDCGLAIVFWPPLKVALSEFIAAPLMSSVNWLNILIIFITLFGGEALIRLHHSLR